MKRTAIGVLALCCLFGSSCVEIGSEAPTDASFEAEAGNGRDAGELLAEDERPDASISRDAVTETDAAPTGSDAEPPGDSGPAVRPIWVTAYLASWNLYAPPGGNWGNLPTEAIDFDAFTHLIFFALSAEADGSLCCIADLENFNADRIQAIVAAAHDAGKPVLFSVGGWGSYDGFSGAITESSRASFVSNLISALRTWGFDGIDLDMEPIEASDVDNYRATVEALRGALDSESTPMLARPLLTAAVGWRPELFASIHRHFDQINLMTYDMSGAWPGWVTWHNAPIRNGDRSFPATGSPLPCAELSVETFLAAGVPAAKLGIGLDFYGYVWSGGEGTSTGGVSEPGQSWTSAPSVQENVPYHEIVESYSALAEHRWDAASEAAYLSIDRPGSAEDRFISFDDETSAEHKVAYVREKGIGGLIIWELGGGYRASAPEGQRDPLLQATRHAAFAN